METVQNAPEMSVSSAVIASPAARLIAQVGVVAAVIVMLACMGVLFAGQFNGTANAATPSSNGSVVIGAAK